MKRKFEVEPEVAVEQLEERIADLKQRISDAKSQ